jgi:hypothetical protein
MTLVFGFEENMCGLTFDNAVFGLIFFSRRIVCIWMNIQRTMGYSLKDISNT